MEKGDQSAQTRSLKGVKTAQHISSGEPVQTGDDSFIFWPPLRVPDMMTQKGRGNNLEILRGWEERRRGGVYVGNYFQVVFLREGGGGGKRCLDGTFFSPSGVS